MGEHKDTRFEFVTELEKLKEQTPTLSQDLDVMIAEAKAGEYHDYKNQKYDCGKVAASTLLRRMGFIPLAKRIENGEFDEIADADDKAMLRAETPEYMWDIFGLREEQGPTAPRRTK